MVVVAYFGYKSIAAALRPFALRPVAHFTLFNTLELLRRGGKERERKLKLKTKLTLRGNAGIYRAHCPTR